ncbi:thermonuclease family protein [Neiella marina]|uniref:Thermonuclease family protein n=1 Tax=Neiella holothuriorum TaxID=2870530 RepID=A0ABS7ECH6_9GAMM|nr:thermonuclease family protein [Neiella holothuriorum]MBW8190041.1 thermonuclease family protein [Neiella holothuriorum]
MFQCSLFSCLIILLALAPCALVRAASMIDCLPQASVSQVTVAQIHDGDTVTLTDNKRVRFAGIDTPEIDHKVPSRNEPFALQARSRLDQLIANQPVALAVDRRPYDRHGRTLGHLVNHQGKNINQQLLLEGYARLMVVGDNDLWRCYSVAEWLARRSKTGIWQQPELTPTPVADITSASKQWREYRGVVSKFVRNQNHSWWLLDNKLWVGGENQVIDQLTIPANSAVEGEDWIVRGVLYQSYGKLRIRVNHSSQIIRTHEIEKWVDKVKPEA